MNFVQLTEDEISTKIENKDVQITVIGLGKMGIPLSLVFTHAGFKVNGLDISENTVNMLNSKKTLLTEEPNVENRLVDAVEKQNFKAFTNMEEAISGSQFILIIIPVLTDDSGKIKLDSLISLYQKLEQMIDAGTIIIQESTLAPGTTSGPIKNVMEINGKKSGIDFGLVFAPERTFSGRAIEDIETRYPKIIGGDTKNASFASKILYEQIASKGVITLRDTTTAEAVKTFKGAYRDVNIAIANQFAILADLYGIDVLEVIEAANTEPFSHIHRPGIGVGGHCIPVYPKFLISDGISMNYNPEVLNTSRMANDFMVDYAIDTIEKNVNEWNKTILVLGLAYRGGIKELRHSPSLRLIPQLKSLKNNVNLYDPLFSIKEIDDIFSKGTGVTLESHPISSFDIVIIVTDHAEFKNIEDKFTNQIIFDGRYVLDHNKIDKGKLLQPGRLVFS